MTQYQLEVAISEIRNRYNALAAEKLQVIRQNKVRRLGLEKQLFDLKSENSLLQGEIEQLYIRMNDELAPLLKQHADIRAQKEAENQQHYES